MYLTYLHKHKIVYNNLHVLFKDMRKMLIHISINKIIIKKKCKMFMLKRHREDKTVLSPCAHPAENIL